MLREHPDIDRHCRWADVKKRVDSDARYRAVESSLVREDYFIEYGKLLKEEKRKAKEKERERKEKKEREKREKERNREKERHKERSSAGGGEGKSNGEDGKDDKGKDKGKDKRRESKDCKDGEKERSGAGDDDEKIKEKTVDNHSKTDKDDGTEHVSLLNICSDFDSWLKTSFCFAFFSLFKKSFETKL